MKDKTNAMRILESKNITYGEYSYAGTGAISGVDAAAAIGQNPEQCKQVKD